MRRTEQALLVSVSSCLIQKSYCFLDNLLTTRIKELFSSLRRWISCFQCSNCLFSSSNSLIFLCNCRSFLIHSCCRSFSLSSVPLSWHLRRSLSITSSLYALFNSLSVIDSERASSLSTLRELGNTEVESGFWLISSDLDFNKWPCFRCRGALPLVTLDRLSYESSNSGEFELMVECLLLSALESRDWSDERACKIWGCWSLLCW